MKKTLVLLLTFALLFSMLALLSSCNTHECSFATNWSYDDVNHWRECVGEECVEISEKAAHVWDNACDTSCNTCGQTRTTEHVWDNACDTSCNTCGQTRTTEHVWNAGEITTKPTQEADGVKTYTCTSCSFTRTEPVPFTGMTEDEWNLIIHLNNFKNFTMNVEMIISTPAIGAKFDSNLKMKFTKDAIYMYAQSVGQTSEEIFDEASTDLAADIVDMFDYNNFTYDAEAKVYRAKGKITVPWDESEPTDTVIRFENDKLVEMKYSYTSEESGVVMEFDNTVTFTDYGTTVIPKS